MKKVTASRSAWAAFAKGAGPLPDGGAPSPLERVRVNRPLGDLERLRRFVSAFEAAGQIVDSQGEPIGTAFAFRGGDLHADLAHERVAMTCTHVVDGEDDLTVRFYTFEGGVKTFRAEVIWSSPVYGCDVAVLRLRPNTFLGLPRLSGWPPRLRLAPNLPPLKISLPRGGTRYSTINMVGVLKNDRIAIDYDDVPFRGASPRKGTKRPLFIGHECEGEPGASGSAILDEHGRVIGVHRSGKRTLQSNIADPDAPDENEAVALPSVVESFKSTWSEKE